MKNRNIEHKDDWATPPYIYDPLNKQHNFDFDPCPFQHNLELWDGLKIEWGRRNFINPPYSLKLKTLFVKKAIEESKKGKLCVMLLPVSTSTKLFHDYILPNKKKIEFIKGRVQFIGVNTKGEYVNWDLWGKNPPYGSIKAADNGMHDSMIVIF